MAVPSYSHWWECKYALLDQWVRLGTFMGVWMGHEVIKDTIIVVRGADIVYISQ